MRRIILICIGLIVFGAMAHHALAHVLKSDGDIGAVVHIDPEDDPIVGQPATFFFDFKDRTNKFSLGACTCTASITNRGQEVFSAPLAGVGSGSELSPFFQYTFPEKSLYTVVVSGKPNVEGAFQPFTLRYDIRVEREQETAPSSATPNHTLHYIIFGGGFVAFFIALFVGRKKGQKKVSAKSIIALLALSGFLMLHTHVVMAATHDAGQVHQDHECCLAQPMALSPSEHSKLVTIEHPKIENTFLVTDVASVDIKISRGPPMA